MTPPQKKENETQQQLRRNVKCKYYGKDPPKCSCSISSAVNPGMHNAAPSVSQSHLHYLEIQANANTVYINKYYQHILPHIKTTNNRNLNQVY